MYQLAPQLSSSLFHSLLAAFPTTPHPSSISFSLVNWSDDCLQCAIDSATGLIYWSASFFQVVGQHVDWFANIHTNTLLHVHTHTHTHIHNFWNPQRYNKRIEMKLRGNHLSNGEVRALVTQRTQWWVSSAICIRRRSGWKELTSMDRWGCWPGLSLSLTHVCVFVCVYVKWSEANFFLLLFQSKSFEWNCMSQMQDSNDCVPWPIISFR